jgi:DNA-binding transcriptional regulator YhcF (GntR family)
MRKLNKTNTLDSKTVSKSVSNMKRAKDEKLTDLTGTVVKPEKDESGLKPAIPAFAKSKSFKSLQAKWYSKLKRDGFNDIEAKAMETDRQSAVMLNGINGAIAQKLQQAGNAEYYRMFDAFVHHSTPDSDSEADKIVHNIVKHIAEGHTNGLTLTDIALHLNSLKIKNPWKQHYNKKPYWHRSFVYNVFTKVVKPWVIQFNRIHPMGTQYQGPNQDAYVDDVMLKEPKGWNID